jgi:hypothetical protein
VLAARATVGRLTDPVPGSVTIQEISIPGDPPVPLSVVGVPVSSNWWAWAA